MGDVKTAIAKQQICAIICFITQKFLHTRMAQFLVYTYHHE